MAKNRPTPTPEVQGSTALPAPPAEESPLPPEQGPAPEAAPTPEVQGEGVRRYRVRNRFEGFRHEPLQEGDEVEATEEEAGPYLGQNGVLEIVE